MLPHIFIYLICNMLLPAESLNFSMPNWVSHYVTLLFAQYCELIYNLEQLTPNKEKLKDSSDMEQKQKIGGIGYLNNYGIVLLPRPECFLKMLCHSNLSSLLGIKGQLEKLLA